MLELCVTAIVVKAPVGAMMLQEVGKTAPELTWFCRGLPIDHRPTRATKFAMLYLLAGASELQAVPKIVVAIMMAGITDVTMWEDCGKSDVETCLANVLSCPHLTRGKCDQCGEVSTNKFTCAFSKTR